MGQRRKTGEHIAHKHKQWSCESNTDTTHGTVMSHQPEQEKQLGGQSMTNQISLHSYNNINTLIIFTLEI